MSTIPLEDPVAYRNWLLNNWNNDSAWLDQVLTPAEVVAEYPFLARSVHTLANWRSQKKGPRYITGFRIGYRRHDILREIERRVTEDRA